MAEAFPTVEVPVHILPDGRKFVTAYDIHRLGAYDLIWRFSHYWARDPNRDGWVSPLPTEEAA